MKKDNFDVREWQLYQMFLNESEEDEDFSVEAPPEWNVTELGIGDILDSSNLKMQDPMRKYEIVDFKVSLFPWENNSVVIKAFQLEEEPIPGTNRTTRQWKHVKNGSFDVEILNNRLKDGFKINPSLNENEEEDFNVEAPPEWNEIELSVGDVITPEMFTLEQKARYWISNKPYRIKKFFGRDGDQMIDMVPAENAKRGEGFECYMDGIQKDLKPQFRIVKKKMFNEEEEDFSVDAPAEWNVKELGIGDKIFPAMLNSNSRMNAPKDMKTALAIIKDFKYIDEDDFTTTITGWVAVISVPHQNRTVNVRVKDINNELQYPYQVVIPPNINESDDEFSVDAPQEWNQEYLSAGDTITPDMWDQSKLGIRKNYFTKPITIDFIGYNEFDDEEEELLVGLEWGDDIIEYDIDFVNHLLKPTFKVVQNKNLFESEDEFSVDAPEEWNYDYWEPTEDISEDEYYKSFEDFVSKVLKNKGVEKQYIDTYLDEVFHFGNFEDYKGISSGELYEDFQQFMEGDENGLYNDF